MKLFHKLFHRNKNECGDVTVEYRVVKFWDDDKADTGYGLLELCCCACGNCEATIVAEGDSEWARREAKHYDVKIEELE